MNKHIKYLVENILDDFYDDDDNDIMGSFHNYAIQDTINAAKKYLCFTNDDNNIKPVNNTDNSFYVQLRSLYRSIGPRKRKRYHESFFYVYIITIDLDGIILYINQALYKDTEKLIFTDNITNFIGNSPINIKEIHYYTHRLTTLNGSQYYEQYVYTNENISNIEKIIIFNKDKKYSDKFVQNFPDIIIPNMNPKFIDNNPNSTCMTKLFKRGFTSDKMFATLVKKLVNNNFNVVDEEFYVYNKNNVDKVLSDLLNNKRQDEIDQKNKNKLDFLKEQIGEEYIDKYNKVINHLLTNKPNVYLKDINTLRKVKIKIEDTLMNLRNENNISNDNIDKTWFFYGSLMYKMLYNTLSNNLNSYKCDYGYGDCANGINTMYGRKTLNINDLPIKFNDIYALYNLYFVIGITALQSDGLDVKINELDEEGYTREQIRKTIETYNEHINSIDNINFDYLNNQLKYILDAACKKYKL